MAFNWSEMDDKKSELFKSLLMGIQEKYKDVFDENKNWTTGKKPDIINNHYIIKYHDGAIGINILDQSYLPLYIQNEIIEAFKEAYSAK